MHAAKPERHRLTKARPAVRNRLNCRRRDRHDFCPGAELRWSHMGNARPGPFGLSCEKRQYRPVSARRRRLHDAPRHVGRNHFQAFPFADVLARLNLSGPVTMSLNLKRNVVVSGAVYLFALCAGVFAAPPLQVAPPLDTPALEFFEARVRPLLAEHCFSCHGLRRQRAGLRLDSREALLQGSENGPVVTAGKPDESALILAIRHEGEVKMPPKGKLPPEAVAVLTTWVTMGAPWPDTPAGAATTTDQAIAAARKNHWAFRPVQRPVVPALDGANGALTEIDHLIAAKMAEKGLQSSPT